MGKERKRPPLRIVKDIDYVVISRLNTEKPDVLRNVPVVGIYGGRRFAGNGYQPGEAFGQHFSFGVMDPARVEFLANGHRTTFIDVKQVLFCGGTLAQPGARAAAAKQTPMAELAASLLANMNVAMEDEIPPDEQAHIITNGASTEIADFTAVEPGDMADSTSGLTSAVPGGDEAILGAQDARPLVKEGPFRDDFIDALRDRAIAAYGPNGQLLDDFDQLWQLQRGQQEALNKQAPFVRTNPYSTLNGILGGRATVTSGGQAKTVAYWVGEDAETTPVTVTLGPIGLLTQAAWDSNTSYRPYAIVQFGTRGYISTVQVDIANGCQFTVSGSQVTVQVAMDPADSGDANGTMDLYGVLSFQQIVRTTPITRTKYVISNDNYDVPAFAKSVQYWRKPQSSAATLTFLSATGQAFGSIYAYVIAANGYNLDPIPLPNDVVAIGTSGDTTGRLIFQLSL